MGISPPKNRKRKSDRKLLHVLHTWRTSRDARQVFLIVRQDVRHMVLLYMYFGVYSIYQQTSASNPCSLRRNLHPLEAGRAAISRKF